MRGTLLPVVYYQSANSSLLAVWDRLGNSMKSKGMSISNSQRWLVTGGCGFIGTNLIAHLVRKEPEVSVRVLDNLSVGTREDLLEVTPFIELDRSPDRRAVTARSPADCKTELLIGDVRDNETCLACCEGIDVIVHLAASSGVPQSVDNPRWDMESNVLGTYNILEAARVQGIDRVIFASSGASVGETELPIHERTVPNPVSPYGAGKLAGEGYCSAYCRTYGMKTVSLRFGNVYGPRSKHKNSVVARFLKQALGGEVFDIHGNGDQTRDYIYIVDLVRAIMLSAKTETGGEIFQIATNTEVSVNEVAAILQELVEDKTGRKVTVVHGIPRLGDVQRNYFDISKARNVLGYQPRFNLRKGLEATLEYFLK